MNKIDTEKTGRIYLWINAISECRSLLDLATKAENAALKLSKDASDGNIKKSYNINEFGSYPDLHQTTQYLRMLAIVLFCQIILKGNKQTNVASKNDKQFVEKELQPCLSKVFPTIEERHKFDELLNNIRDARDGVIGHADAKYFNINYGETISSVNMHSKCLENIDFVYWRKVIEPVYRELFNQL